MIGWAYTVTYADDPAKAWIGGLAVDLKDAVEMLANFCKDDMAGVLQVSVVALKSREEINVHDFISQRHKQGSLLEDQECTSRG